METIEFRLNGEHVRLCDLLKLAGIAESGGQGSTWSLLAGSAWTVSGRTASRQRSAPGRS